MFDHPTVELVGVSDEMSSQRRTDESANAHRGRAAERPVPTTRADPARAALALFRVVGNRAASDLVQITRASGAPRAVARAPLTYRDTPLDTSLPTGGDEKAIDKDIRALQDQAKDKLGVIEGLDQAPDENERRGVKWLIWQYFTSAHARSEEIHAVLTTGVHIDAKAGTTTSRQVMYRLIFKPGKSATDVSVTRVTPKGAGTTDVNALDLTAVNGFPGAAAKLGQIHDWAAKRFPALAKIEPKKGEDAAAYVARLGAERVKQASSDAWFTANYDITFLSGTDAAERLQKIHGFSQDAVMSTKDVEPETRLALEQALEPLGDTFLGELRGLKVARQEVRRVPPTSKSTREDPSAYGVTHQDGTERTTILFDLINSQETLFVGTSHIRSRKAMSILHELGHAIRTAGSTDLQKDFNAEFVSAKSKKKLEAPTSYGRSDPGKEFFPEAFALFQLDPEYVRRELPDVAAFFDKASTPPKKD
jgi:hypothetical protein